MGKMLDLLLDKMDDNLGDTCLSCDEDEWDNSDEGADWAWCSEESAGVSGEIFLVKDLFKNLPKNIKNCLYSYRFRYQFPPIKEMTEDQIEKLFTDWVSNWKFNESSPFGSGSEQDWDYEFFTYEGKRYMFTYEYMGS